MSDLPQPRKDRPPRFVGRIALLNSLLNIALQDIYPRIGMSPTITQRLRVERPQRAFHRWMSDKQRPPRHQQSDRQLNRSNLIRQTEGCDVVQQCRVTGQTGPRGEGHERRGQGKAGIARDRQRLDEVGPRVPFVENFEAAIVQRFDRGRDKKTPGRSELGQ